MVVPHLQLADASLSSFLSKRKAGNYNACDRAASSLIARKPAAGMPDTLMHTGN